LPDYEVSYLPYSNDSYSRYSCTLRFFVPKNDKGVHEDQRVDVSGESRGKARELAAERAYWFVMSKGLWMRLEDANIVPDPETSINQLQELYQKGYVEEPSYTIEEDVDIFGESSWECRCVCSGAEGVGRARRKVHAKKKAAFMSLVRLLKGAGICKPEWENMMWVQVRLSGER
jgi:ribonuclease-3